jgi:hypothetical protein
MGIISVALAVNAQRAEKIVINFACDSGAQVGDLVYADTVTDNKVISITDNNSVRHVIGIIEGKQQATVAQVLIVGTLDGFSGLTKGYKVWISHSGVPTTTKPTSGYLHQIGTAISSTEILFISNQVRTKLV